MTKPNLLTNLFHFYSDGLSKKERLLVETFFGIYLYQELIFCYEPQINKANKNHMEDIMGNDFVIRSLVNDLLTSKEYSLAGLASYTGYPEDVIYDLAAGTNVNPTLLLAAKIVELHALTRRELYQELIKKIMDKLRDKKEDQN